MNYKYTRAIKPKVANTFNSDMVAGAIYNVVVTMKIPYWADDKIEYTTGYKAETVLEYVRNGIFLLTKADIYRYIIKPAYKHLEAKNKITPYVNYFMDKINAAYLDQDIDTIHFATILSKLLDNNKEWSGKVSNKNYNKSLKVPLFF